MLQGSDGAFYGINVLWCGVMVWFGVVLNKYDINIVLQNSVIVCIPNTAQYLAGMINIAGDSKMQAGVAPGIYQSSWF